MEDSIPAGFATAAAYDFPTIVNANVLRGACPCRCIHCPVGRTEPGERGQRFGSAEMPFDVYARIVDEMRLFGSHSLLRIHGVGEPVLWSKLPEAVRYASHADVRTWLFTSAVTSDRSLLATLCQHVSIIEVSVNSTDAEDYERTKGIPAFALVVDNLGYLRALARERALATRLIVSRVQSADPERDRNFAPYWKATSLVDDAFVRSYHTYNNLLDPLGEMGPEARHGPCLVHWARFNVDCDGKAVICFNHLFGEVRDEFVLGDLRAQSIREIWQGPKLAAIREAELSGNYARLEESGLVFPCRRCLSYQPLFGHGETSECQLRHIKKPVLRSSVAAPTT